MDVRCKFSLDRNKIWCLIVSDFKFVGDRIQASKWKLVTDSSVACVCRKTRVIIY